jgi:DNA-binding IclR family transcriptional regulator
MRVKRDIKSEILELLKNAYPEMLMLKEIAERLKISRTSAARYVDALEAEGRIVCKKAGTAKLCRYKE